MAKSDKSEANKIGPMHVICRDCGTHFIIQPAELRWLKERKLEPFSRCVECRRRRREEQLQRALFAPPGEKRRPW